MDTKRNNTKIIIIALSAAAVALVVAIICLIFHFANQKPTDNNTGNNGNNTSNVAGPDDILIYGYADSYVPPTTYSATLNQKTKELVVEEYHSCSAVDCDGTTEKNSVILTDDEFEKVRTIFLNAAYYDQDMFVFALSELAQDQTVVRWDYDADSDTNGDGKVVAREIGDFILDDVYNNPDPNSDEDFYDEYYGDDLIGPTVNR